MTNARLDSSISAPLRTGRHRTCAVHLRALAFAAALTTASAGCGDGDPQPISVLTRNLYLGSDLGQLFFALDVPQLSDSAARVWREVMDSAFHQRAEKLVAEIVTANPDVLALQEVSLFRTQTPGDWQSGAAPNASQVELDFLEILSRALASRGLDYRTTDMGAFTDQELPALAADGSTFDVRLTDRNVTMVREGLAFASGPAAPFTADFTFPTGGPGGASITLQRGYVSTDVTVGGKTARVVNTHLEVGGPLARTQEEQARELIRVLAPYGGPIILTGDFNSPADNTGTASYGLLTTASGGAKPFLDAWQFRNRQRDRPISLIDGNTCCLELTDATALPSERIDLVLFRGGIRPVDEFVVEPSRTTGGLWPSDHLGVAAELQIH